MAEERPFAELSASGLLWLINTSVLHPRGFALALVIDESGTATGWQLLGDGTEPWMYDREMHDQFAAAEQTLSRVPARIIEIQDADVAETDVAEIRERFLAAQGGTPTVAS